jgi:hypothetical protein
MQKDERSNVSIRSNVMLDDKHHQRKYRYLPGDFAAQVYQECRDVRTADQYLSPEQLVERRQYIVCRRCQRPCAGTCER